MVTLHAAQREFTQAVIRELHLEDAVVTLNRWIRKCAAALGCLGLWFAIPFIRFALDDRSTLLSRFVNPVNRGPGEGLRRSVNYSGTATATDATDATATEDTIPALPPCLWCGRLLHEHIDRREHKYVKPPYSLPLTGNARARAVRTKVVAVLVIVLGFASVVAAEPRIQLSTQKERRIADVVSWGTVAATLVIDTESSWNAPDRRQAFLKQGIRLGVTYGIVWAAKLAVQRDRPCAPNSCGSDNPHYSFFSGHSAAAFQALGGSHPAVILPLAFTTGGLRVAAGKHWLSDVLVGAGVGLATSRIR